jgi:DNA-binding NtrC family response regulator
MKRKIKVLIVDDEPLITSYAKQELEMRNKSISVITKSNGYEALQEIMTGGIHLLLTDIAMPDMDGYELFSRARELRENLPVIMMTGFGWDPNHAIVKAKQDGLHDVFFKPLDYDSLIKKIMERTGLKE